MRNSVRARGTAKPGNLLPQDFTAVPTKPQPARMELTEIPSDQAIVEISENSALVRSLLLDAKATLGLSGKAMAIALKVSEPQLSAALNGTRAIDAEWMTRNALIWQVVRDGIDRRLGVATHVQHKLEALKAAAGNLIDAAAAVGTRSELAS